MNRIRGVLFDLDGTLLDTAPDLVFALNKLRNEYNLPDLPVSAMREIANLGSKAMVKMAFDMDEKHADFMPLREKFLSIYEKHLADATTFFPRAEQVLTLLEERNIPWGIVTNKLTRHTLALLKALQVEHRPACIICGDSLPTFKPDPAPIRYACELLKLKAEECIYVGDAVTDVLASRAAGMRSLVALYGYINKLDDPYSWKADGYLGDLMELVDWLDK